MIRVEVSGAGPCSGLLLLPPNTAARWQAVRRRLACPQLVILAEKLLQLAETHCRHDAPVGEESASQASSSHHSGTREPDSMLPLEHVRGRHDRFDQSEATLRGAAYDLRSTDLQARSEVSWGHDVTSGQLCSTNNRQDDRLLHRSLDSGVDPEFGAFFPEGADSHQLTELTVSRRIASDWRGTYHSDVMTCSETMRDHVNRAAECDYMSGQPRGTSRDDVAAQCAVSRDQQVSVIFSSESLERIDEFCASASAQNLTTAPSPPQELHGQAENFGGDYRMTGGAAAEESLQPPAAWFDATSDRRPPLRPPGSSRPCVLRRGRAICSTDRLTIDDAASAPIDVPTGQAENGGSERSYGDLSNTNGSEVQSVRNFDQAACVPDNANVRNVSQDTPAAEHQRHPTAERLQNVIAREDPDMVHSAAPPASQRTPSADGDSLKMPPPSLCAECDTEHAPAACPLQHPRCWVQDSPGGGAEETLPPCLRIDGSTIRAGPDGVAAYTLLGPLVGRPVRPEQLIEPVDLRHVWEIYGEGVFLDTSDPAASSWFRLLRPAARRSQRTLAVVTRQRHLFAVTTCHLAAGTELTYWQDDTETAWRGKNMLKTRCGGCNLKFEHPLYYRRHCSLFHEPGTPLAVRKYYCRVCGEGLLGRQSLLRHAVDEHDGAGAYQCQHCGKYFRRRSYLDLHRNHGCSSNPERSHPLCHLCGARFSQPQKLAAHVRRVHTDPDPSLSDLRCPRCERVLASRTAVRRHIREVHASPEASEPALRCARCGKQFRNQCNLKVHMLTHSGVKPFRCSLAECGAAFTTKQCLQQHYGRAHQLRGGAMPAISRVIPYTVRAYAGLSDPEPEPEPEQEPEPELEPEPGLEPAALTRRRPLCRGDRLRFSNFSVSRDLPEPSSGPRLVQEASRSELDCIEPSYIVTSRTNVAGVGFGGAATEDAL